MARELSYVIACLQEIELALAQLKPAATIDYIENIDVLIILVRSFFQSPGQVAAEKVLSTLQKYSTAANPWMQKSIVVDGITTTLTGLREELTEVLEDLA